MKTLSAVTKQQLLEQAHQAAKLAYCPYSHFRVGAAVLAEGKIYVGCNVENASYGLTVCAERVALFNAVAAGSTKTEALAVVTPDAKHGDSPRQRMPCGACRQVMAEIMTPDATIIIEGEGEFGLEELLPHPFELKAPEASVS